MCYYLFMQDKGSFLSIIILLVLFVVLPAAMKFLGQYTLSSKGLDKKQQDEERTPEEKIREYMEGPPTQHDYNMDKPAVSNKPITPRWF
jgi:hypothetical protein